MFLCAGPVIGVEFCGEEVVRKCQERIVDILTGTTGKAGRLCFVYQCSYCRCLEESRLDRGSLSGLLHDLGDGSKRASASQELSLIRVILVNLDIQS